ncbi:MAG: hypothetical protein A2541_00740 [Candidatus Taylorbacteria bacterium RIFOXYD2_FULL_36_9]|uniref:Uncharacterized protein n=1 Tax=Candidatus Taylorbacteria bacterium RIFOXYD2_FULL_36_9 TaxID=1802338 RepID=A0A1G2PHP0_9BACT|nr:MAG: hypothetical protein A2541_00740 [Candidatus Taylorbacteria bacterium RIFOXYD2_FULL_36_9]
MYKYLPSKRFSFIMLSIILALGIIYLFSFLKEKQIEQKTLSVETKTKIQEFMAIDSDGDGMKDWEEALWKTDPKKMDTDNDGTNDGEEIRLNRDPLKQNINLANQTPSDKISEEVIAADKKAQTEFAKLTETEKLAQTFFSQYLASKSESPLDTTSKQVILDTAISMAEVPNQPKYTLTSLKINDKIDSTILKEYGNSLGQAFFTGTATEIVDNEVAIMNKVMQTNDEKVLKELDPIIESYQKTINKILLINVPREVTSLHLSFLNDLESIKSDIEKMKLLFSDPVQSMAGIGEYQKVKANLLIDLADIKDYFNQKQINFNQSEYGYILLNII